MIKFNGTKVIKGIRTNAWSGREKEVELTYFVKLGVLFRLWFHIYPGVTGYESFEFEPNGNARIKEKGWSACAGTKERWDSLFISPKEMTKAIEDIEQVIQNS